MEKRIKKLIISIITFLIIFNVTSYANLDITQTKAYKKWNLQTNEQKESSIQPMPFTVDLKNSVKRSYLNEILKETENEEIPEKYNLNDDITIQVKNQQQTNSCWAFSTTSIFETTIAKTKNKSVLFSPRHMEYATSRNFLDGVNSKGYNREIDSGGNAYIGFNYATAGNGPVLEKDMPFENNKEKINLSDIQNKKVETKLSEYKIFPAIEKEITSNKIIYTNGEEGDLKVTYTEEEINAIRTLIKKHIMEYGGISSNNYIGNEGEYFNKEKIQNGETSEFAYYCNNNAEVPNHAITIVGWDDTYSAENFEDTCKPKNNGAYIVLNSYGAEMYNKGYFYISYDDVFVESGLLGISKTEEVDYDNIYQYDEFGASTEAPMINANDNTVLTSLYAVNVYEKGETVESKKEYLNEIAVSVNQTSNIEIYANVENDDKTKIEKVASPGILEPGYYTIKLPTPLEIKGEKFVVGARYINQEGVSLPLECNLKENGSISTYWDVATGEKGQSFVSSDKNIWKDVITDLEIKQSNVCVKAFTSYVEDKDIKVESISLNKNKLEMTEGESINLEVTFNPSDATNKKVKWLTDNINIASVDANGNIKAVKEGTTIITAISEDGGKTAKCEVTIKKKQTSDDDIYYDDETKDTGLSISKENATLKYTKKVDETTSNKILPYAGKNIIIISIVAIIGIGMFTYIKIRKYKDVK